MASTGAVIHFHSEELANDFRAFWMKAVLNNNLIQVSYRFLHAKNVLSSYLKALKSQANIRPDSAPVDIAKTNIAIFQSWRDLGLVMDWDCLLVNVVQRTLAGRGFTHTDVDPAGLDRAGLVFLEALDAKNQLHLVQARLQAVDQEMSLREKRAVGLHPTFAALWKWLRAESRFRFVRGLEEAGFGVVIRSSSSKTEEELLDNKTGALCGIQSDAIDEVLEKPECAICHGANGPLAGSRRKQQDYTSDNVKRNIHGLASTLVPMLKGHHLHTLTGRRRYPNKPVSTRPAEGFGELPIPEAEPKPQEAITSPCCNHHFHCACLAEWVMRYDDEVDEHCPYCRSWLGIDCITEALERFNSGIVLSHEALDNPRSERPVAPDVVHRRSW